MAREIKVASPRNGAEREAVRLWDGSELEEGVVRATAAVRHLSGTTMGERAEWMQAAAEELERRRDALALLMAEEMGKPVAQGRAEVEKCAWVCRYYAEHAEAFLAEEERADGARVVYRPLGVILAVMPWNFPLWQVFRFAAPALMAGNVCLLKHDLNVQGCAAQIEDILRVAGFAEGCLQNVPIDQEEVAMLLADQRVCGVTLTGSGRAGRAVAETAGRHLKKCVLELGGSDPYLVLEDADLEVAVQACAASRLLNSGQTCISAKRFLVHESLHRDFVAGMIEAFREQVVGDPRGEETTVGPLARKDLQEKLRQQVLRSIESGARLVFGGGDLEGMDWRRGAYFPPLILDEVRPGMPAFEEELFGPVAAVCRVATEEEAIVLANQSRFGLGAAVFSRDEDRARRIAADQIEAGCVAINGFVGSDPRLPFGGVKESGFGRELSEFGIREFVNVKTITS